MPVTVPEKKRLASLGMTAGQYEKVLERIVERRAYGREKLDRIFAEGRKDMLCVAGDPWPALDRRAREKARRPCMTFDEISQYLNQTINDLKENKLAVKFSPKGLGASTETAEFYGNLWREIEYRSKAPDQYVHACKDAIERGYGYVKLTAKYVPESMDQELWVEQVADPDAIEPDPDAKDRAGRDWRYLFETEMWTPSEYRTQFKEAEITSFEPFLGGKTGGGGPLRHWLSIKSVTVAGYYEVEQKKQRVARIKQGTAPAVDVVVDRMPEGKPRERLMNAKANDRIGDVVVLGARDDDRPEVWRYLTNGVEILERTRWVGPRIPFAACYGKINYINRNGTTERELVSMTRPGREPFLAYCFYRTSEMENVGRTTKNPYWAYRHQLIQEEMDLVETSMHEPVALLTAAATIEGVDGILPLPQPNVSEPAILALAKGAEEARRSIQAAMQGMPLATDAQRVNNKSGKALDRIERSGQRGTYHFRDSQKDMIAAMGEMGEEVIDLIYDTAREVAIRKPDDTPDQIWINDPQRVKDGGLASIKGKHTVTVADGPNFADEREEASVFADTVLSNEMLMQLAGPDGAKEIASLAVQLKAVGPLGDQIAKILNPKLGKEQPMPPQAVALLKQAEQAFQQAQREIQGLRQVIQEKVVERDMNLKRAQIDAETRKEVALIQKGTKEHDTETGAALDLKLQEMDDTIARLKLIVELEMQRREHEHEGHMAEGAQMASSEMAREGVEGQLRGQREGAQSQRVMQREGKALDGLNQMAAAKAKPKPGGPNGRGGGASSSNT